MIDSTKVENRLASGDDDDGLAGAGAGAGVQACTIVLDLAVHA